MPLFSLLAFGLLCWLSCASCEAAGPGAEASPPPHAIWSGLVFATNDPHPTQAPERLRQFAQKLKNIFGYNQFELVGEYAEKMGDPFERWLIPSKDFSLSVKTHNEPGQRYRTRIVLFQNRQRLAEFETHLNPDSPLFIRGPQYAGGQLVIVLHEVDASQVPVHTPRPVVGTVIATPVIPGAEVSPGREKANSATDAAEEVPKEPFYPTPAGHIGPEPVERAAPVPADHFGPGPADHPGPMQGQRPGDLDMKGLKP
jgi:hypothetical protein